MMLLCYYFHANPHLKIANLGNKCQKYTLPKYQSDELVHRNGSGLGGLVKRFQLQLLRGLPILDSVPIVHKPIAEAVIETQTQIPHVAVLDDIDGGLLADILADLQGVKVVVVAAAAAVYKGFAGIREGVVKVSTKIKDFNSEKLKF